MALHGARPTMVWSLLRHTAAAGAWKLTVQGEAGWQADDVILVASTGDDESQTETCTLLAAKLVPAPGGGWDTEVGLDAPLLHAHHGETEIHNGHTLELRAEVGVISRLYLGWIHLVVLWFYLPRFYLIWQGGRDQPPLDQAGGRRQPRGRLQVQDDGLYLLWSYKLCLLY